jgi:hypothetical protein
MSLLWPKLTELPNSSPASNAQESSRCGNSEGFNCRWLLSSQVALRYEVRFPLAVWFAQQAALAATSAAGSVGYPGGHGASGSALERGLKRFEVGRVRRAARGGTGLPASYLQVSRRR